MYRERDYFDLISRLHFPRKSRFDLTLKENEGDEDTPDWLAPENWTQTYNLMLRLPLLAQVVCTLTAIEMILPVWEDWWINYATHFRAIAENWLINPESRTYGLRDIPQINPLENLPYEAIAVATRWLEGYLVQSTETSQIVAISYALAGELTVALEDVELTLSIPPDTNLIRRGSEELDGMNIVTLPGPAYLVEAAGHLSYCICILLRNEEPAWAPRRRISNQAADCVCGASLGGGLTTMEDYSPYDNPYDKLVFSYKQFLKRWWTICRTRLSARDVSEGEIQWYRT